MYYIYIVCVCRVCIYSDRPYVITVPPQNLSRRITKAPENGLEDDPASFWGQEKTYF